MKTALILSLMVALAAPGSAQVPDRESRPGSHPPAKKKDRAMQLATMRQMHQRFGDCVIQKHHAKAVTYLLEHLTVDSNDRVGRNLISVLADGHCLLAASEVYLDGAVMTLPGDTMRYALADALIRRDFAAAPLRDFNRVAPLTHPVLNLAEYQPKSGKKVNAKDLGELAAERGKEQARIYLSRFGECVARVDPAKSHALLMTLVNSAAERAAFAGLTPRLGECLAERQTVTLNKVIIRGSVGQGYYRLAKAPRFAVPPGAGVSE